MTHIGIASNKNVFGAIDGRGRARTAVDRRAAAADRLHIYIYFSNRKCIHCDAIAANKAIFSVNSSPFFPFHIYLYISVVYIAELAYAHT